MFIFRQEKMMLRQKNLKLPYTGLFFTVLILLLSINCTQKKPVKDLDIVLISIDTLRTDHLGCYGYSRNTSPNIDRIAKEGVLFKNVISSSSWTSPAMASLFTSLYTSKHGVIHGVMKEGKVYSQEVFSDSLVRIPTVLKKHGYFTMGFSSNPHMTKALGFSKDFDIFVYGKYFNARKINKAALGFKKKNLPKNKKLFLWVHYFDPHWKYNPMKPWIDEYSKNITMKNFNEIKLKQNPKEFIMEYKLKENKELIKFLMDCYDSEINFTDEALGNLLRRLNLDKDKTLIIIVADHGEEFFEHNDFTHGNNLYNETLRIPLIIKFPRSMNVKGMSIKENVGIIDVFPTILDALNIPQESTFDGKSLLPLIVKRKGYDKRVIMSELYRDKNTALSSNQGKWKYIHDYKDNKTELFDLETDKNEKINLADKNSDVKQLMESHIVKFLDSLKGRSKIKREVITPDEKTIKELKSLGYVE
ncbi:MAG: hypothetical protein A3C43_01430 [Candidatus Schekmanbacteria bacterium RIFCSPHIGHO2_02_FULL_38_11]|uniref:Sulfatase N-terminal domain-containing protein n=1 Tax=Candidatus Schekmanbacteria bacterium RIFCSPLOWO2_12_FULL_38_15 TaxID=1817883 RepID=A0A1F7SNK0_9BACT|nr:MAG: hypothetical protein A2043_10505 [Candidatus Schekmanbacteria bacterium GWA2_38_9]OGL48836.1 MAG: hypothetical protein A3H37_11510 [Candidatus Schekmanbacteria bacterium RIFCSPLOWO2_02_FULL_38_14]OGL49780.1 MAG: hypothetical protein A3C43_01430 [Candidatus Schekmanbacteria bacterium RIFCSPHIGHO2_02_FULL_38_11]OGL55333.1 MAG: hypothetical protein A3G31_04845 [Candidatus Schekmanbacteria bacterium RIFCSPLOWO2_12_FULL_38_15]